MVMDLKNTDNNEDPEHMQQVIMKKIVTEYDQPVKMEIQL